MLVVLGGPVAVDAPVFDRAGRVHRWGGAPDRGPEPLRDAANIARTYYESETAVAYVATGQNFPDALAGGPAAFLEDGPVVLVTRDEITAPTEAVMRALEPERIVVVLGGQQAVKDQLGRGSTSSPRVRSNVGLQRPRRSRSRRRRYLTECASCGGVARVRRRFRP